MASFGAVESPVDVIPSRRFALDATTVSDPFGAFRDLVMPNMETIYETVPLEPFEVAAQTVVLGRIGVAYMRVSSQRWDRSRAITKRNDVDHIVVSVRFAGGALGEAESAEMKARSGEI